jgi:hypothetical protein
MELPIFSGAVILTMKVEILRVRPLASTVAILILMLAELLQSYRLAAI